MENLRNIDPDDRCIKIFSIANGPIYYDKVNDLVYWGGIFSTPEGETAKLEIFNAEEFKKFTLKPVYRDFNSVLKFSFEVDTYDGEFLEGMYFRSLETEDFLDIFIQLLDLGVTTIEGFKDFLDNVEMFLEHQKNFVDNEILMCELYARDVESNHVGSLARSVRSKEICFNFFKNTIYNGLPDHYKLALELMI